MSSTGLGLAPADVSNGAQGNRTSEAQAPIAVEMNFEDTAEQTSFGGGPKVKATSAAENTRPPLALAIAPSEPTKPVLAAVNALPADSGDQTAPRSPAASRQPGLARLFAFGKARPRVDVDRATTPARGATSRDPRPVIDPAPAAGDLPGVRLGSLFGINTGKPGSADEPVRMASAAGLARLAPNGLRAQSDSVEMACFKPELVQLLDRVRRHYGREIVVTSGYRSPKHNRKAGGARGSRHTTCEAADIQVPGVGKWELAKYLKTVKGRGGVGTYCHTQSVHIDVGSKRDWNWRCRRR